MLFGLEERAGDRSGPESPQRRRLLRGLAALAAVASVRPLMPLLPVEGGGRAIAFTPAVLTADIAARYLAGGEWMGERELRRFGGRFFRTRINNTVYGVLLSSEVYRYFAGKVTDYEQDLIPASSYNWFVDRAVRNYVNQENPWRETLTRVFQDTSFSNRNIQGRFFVFTYDDQGEAQVVNLQDDHADWDDRRQNWWTGLSGRDLQRATIFSLSDSNDTGLTQLLCNQKRFGEKRHGITRF